LPEQRLNAILIKSSHPVQIVEKETDMPASKTNNQKKQTAKNKTPAPQTKKTQVVKSAAEAEKPGRSMAKRQKTAIILFASAVLFGCIVLIKGENVWTFLHDAMRGLFGYCAYIWPFMLLYLSIAFAVNKPLGNIATNLAGIGAFTTLIGGLIHIFLYGKDIDKDSVWLQMKQSWIPAQGRINGGSLGALVGGGCAKVVGSTAASIIIIVVLAVLFLLLTGTTLPKLFRSLTKPVKKAGEIAGNRKAAAAARAAAAAEEPRTESKREFVLPPVETARDDDLSPGENEYIPAVPAEFLPAGLQGAIASKDGAKEGKVTASSDAAGSKTKPQSTPIFQAANDHRPQNGRAFDHYQLPPIDCLNAPVVSGWGNTEEEQRSTANKLIETLRSFGVSARVVGICPGPAVTRYEIQPDAGVRISKITNLSDDLALRLAASHVRIEAPIPNKSAIGIEIPNSKRVSVTIREIIDTNQYRSVKSKLNVALGKDITGNIVCADLAKMPHLLIAGTTGSGKSVCLNTMIISILYNASPTEVKMLMIDPKQVEFSLYNGISHLEVPVVCDPRKAAGALGWAVSEMQKRYKMFSECNARDIESYNKIAEKSPDGKKMYRIVIFIDELSDLMMVAPNEVEDSIFRLAQMARAAGMHLVVATQRPSVDVITGTIKANIPSRIAFSVSAQLESRIILDMSGAEKLVGNGDMLFNPVGMSKPLRVQGCYISEREVESVVAHVKAQSEYSYDEEIMKEIERHAAAEKKRGGAGGDDTGSDGDDDMLPKAIQVVAQAQIASTTLLQRRLKLGYARAARIMDSLEEKGIIGPFEGSKPRKVLITKQQYLEKYALSDEFADSVDDAGEDDEEEDDGIGTEQ